jgi:hypothetical protein
MKTKSLHFFTLLFFTAVLLSSCAFRAGRGNSNSAGTALPTVSAPQAEVATAVLRPTRTPKAKATQASAKDAEPARLEQSAAAAKAYFAAVADGNSEAAAQLLSNFSLVVFEMTRGDAVSALQAQKIAGARWADLQVLETKRFDEDTILVHVTYTVSQKLPPTVTPTASKTPNSATATVQAGKTPVATATPAQAGTVNPGPTAIPADVKDELWPFRLENGAWRYNWNNLIDFRTLNAPAQTMNGVTLLPLQLNRYSDRIALVVLVQNRTTESVVFGQLNETLGTFQFGDQTVVAETTRWILNPLRSVPGATLEIKGLYAAFPDSVEIRKWKTYNVDPWYIFQLN